MFLRVAEEDGEKQSDEVKRNKLEENTDSKWQNSLLSILVIYTYKMSI